MGFIVEAVADISSYIYAVCGLLALWQLYKTWQVRAERRQAIFSLEREKTLGDLYNIFMTAMALLLVMGLTYFTSTTLKTALADSEDAGTATRESTPEPAAIGNLIPTPTYTPAPPTPTATPTVESRPLAPVIVPQTEPVLVEAPTPTPESPPVAPALCPDGRAVILSPGNGAVVSGIVPIVGTAQHDQFDYYKLEFAPGGGADQGFSYFDGGQAPVGAGLLGNLNSSALPNGVYTIQLVVVDQTGNYPEPCRVTITVQN